MLTGIDHLIVAVADVDAAAAQLESGLGISSGGGGRHGAHGTHNRLIWLGDSYLELMGVFDADLARSSWWGQHILARLGATGGGLAGVVLATDDVAADVARLQASGSPLLTPTEGERVRPDGDVVRWRMGRLPAPDPDLGLIFLIEHDLTAAEWRAPDRAARARDPRLRRVEVPVADVARATMRLLRDFGLQFRPSLAGGGTRDTELGFQTLRLRRTSAGAVPVAQLTGLRDSKSVELLGVNWTATDP